MHGKTDHRILFFIDFTYPGKDLHSHKFPTAYGDRPFYDPVTAFKFTGDLIFQIHHFQSTAFKKDPLISKGDPMSAPVKKSHSQFCLQSSQLPGKCRLGNMQLFGSFSKTLFLCHCQEITQYS